MSRCRDIRTLWCRGTGISVYDDAGILGYCGIGISIYQNIGMPAYRDISYVQCDIWKTGTSGYKGYQDIEMLGFVDAGISRYRITRISEY